MLQSKFRRILYVLHYFRLRNSTITPVLRDLHWLPLKARVEYKCAVFAYQCLNDDSFPSYIKDMLTIYNPSRSLRSSAKKILDKPRVSLRNYGERTFSFATSDMWNNLPYELKSAPSLVCFKQLLKTHLFIRHYQ